jgi:hypothetical protein
MKAAQGPHPMNRRFIFKVLLLFGFVVMGTYLFIQKNPTANRPELFLELFLAFPI